MERRRVVFHSSDSWWTAPRRPIGVWCAPPLGPSQGIPELHQRQWKKAARAPTRMRGSGRRWNRHSGGLRSSPRGLEGHLQDDGIQIPAQAHKVVAFHLERGRAAGIPFPNYGKDEGELVDVVVPDVGEAFAHTETGPADHVSPSPVETGNMKPNWFRFSDVRRRYAAARAALTVRSGTGLPMVFAAAS